MRFGNAKAYKTFALVAGAVLLLALSIACSHSISETGTSEPENAYTDPGPSNPAYIPPYESYTPPYSRADLEGEPYKVTLYTEGCHSGDAVFSCKRDNQWHLYRVTPQGETVDTFSYEWQWGGARLLENGNYLMGDANKRILEVAPGGEIVWELNTEGRGIGPSHHIIPLPNGNLLINDCDLDKFVEIKRDGEVVFEWCAEDHLKAYDPTTYVGYEILGEYAELCSIYAGSPLTNWTHINFVQKLPDGNYIASLANQDLVIEVDGKSGEIVWSYGPGIIKHQHTPIVYGNYMYIFDNGNGRVIKVNRNTGYIVLEIKGLLAPIWGDVRRLPNGNLLITDSFRNRAIEVNESTGEIVWEIQMCSAQGGVWAEGTW